MFGSCWCLFCGFWLFCVFVFLTWGFQPASFLISEFWDKDCHYRYDKQHRRKKKMQKWMSEVDLALQDESQQFGNLDEVSAIARMPWKCLVMWLGDH